MNFSYIPKNDLDLLIFLSSLPENKDNRHIPIYLYIAGAGGKIQGFIHAKKSLYLRNYITKPFTTRSQRIAQWIDTWVTMSFQTHLMI